MTPLKRKHLLAARHLRFMVHLQPYTAPEMYKAIGVNKQNWSRAWNGENCGLSEEKIELLKNFLKQNNQPLKKQCNECGEWFRPAELNNYGLCSDCESDLQIEIQSVIDTQNSLNQL